MKQTVTFVINGNRTEVQGVKEAKKVIGELVQTLSMNEQKVVMLYIKRNQMFFRTPSTECFVGEC